MFGQLSERRLRQVSLLRKATAKKKPLMKTIKHKKGQREGTLNLITDCYLVRIMGTLLSPLACAR